MKNLETMQFGERQERLSFPSEKRALLLLNEKVVTIHAIEDDGMKQEEQTLYEYDGMFLDVESPNEASVLAKVKELKMAELMSYDSSEHVNQFTFSGVNMWLDKATRNGLMMRFNAEKSKQLTSTSLWYGNYSFSLDIGTGISMLYAIELYASECYDNTQRHRKAIYDCTTIEDVVTYNYTVGYPEKLVF